MMPKRNVGVRHRKNSRQLEPPPPQLHTFKTRLSSTAFMFLLIAQHKHFSIQSPSNSPVLFKLPQLKRLPLNQTTKPLRPSILSCLPLPSSPSSQLNPTQPPYLPEGNAPFLRIRKYLSLQALMLTSSGKSPLSHSSAQVLNPFVTRTPASPNAVFSSSVHMWIFLPAMLPPTFPPLLRRWRGVLAAA